MGQDYYKWVYEAIAHIEANLGETLNLPEVAEQAGYSVFHFGRIFQGITGETVMEYVRKRRLTEAGKALLHSNQRILDIALDWQYDSQEAFTRAFKRAYGVPPGTFRRRKKLHPTTFATLPPRPSTFERERSSYGNTHHRSPCHAGGRHGLHWQE